MNTPTPGQESNKSDKPKRKRMGGHAKIAKAYKANRGVWLSPADVEDLWWDDAVRRAHTQEDSKPRSSTPDAL